MSADEPLTDAELMDARQNPFSGQVLGDETIVCLECGYRFELLGSHLRWRHALSGDDYREKWGYRIGQGLCSRAHSALAKRRLAGTHQKPHNPLPVRPLRAFRPQSLEKLREARERISQKRREASTYVSVAMVLNQRDEGYNTTEIAGLLKCSRDMVRRRLREAGCTRARPHSDVTREQVVERRLRGDTLRDIATEIGCSLTFLFNLLKKTRPVLSRPDVLWHLSLGRSVSEVAIIYSVSRQLIEQMSRRSQPSPKRKTESPCYAPAGIDASTVLSLWRDGHAMCAIARELRCSWQSVRKCLLAAGETPVTQTNWIAIPIDDLARCRRQGMTIPEMASRFGCSKGSISNRLRDIGLPPPVRRSRRDVSIEAVVEKRLEGKTLVQIAAIFGCSVALVRRRLGEAIRQGIAVF